MGREHEKNKYRRGQWREYKDDINKIQGSGAGLILDQVKAELEAAGASAT